MYFRFLYAELQNLISCNKSSILRYDCDKVKLLPNIQFHFYISQTPCGDASIVSMENIKKRKANEELLSKFKQRKLDIKDGTRTGSKPVPGETPDPKAKDCYHNNIETLRNKPGRGEFTQCMSCSDKIMKWTSIGCQGALLSQFLSEPIRFSSIVIGESVFDVETINRSINLRLIRANLIQPEQMVAIFNSNIEFKFSHNMLLKKLNDPKPCGSAISWTNLSENQLEIIAANGYVLGMTRKDLEKSNKISLICSKAFFKSFKRVCALSVETNLAISSIIDIPKLFAMNYRNAKDISPYSNASTLFKSTFKNWFKHDYELDRYT